MNLQALCLSCTATDLCICLIYACWHAVSQACHCLPWTGGHLCIKPVCCWRQVGRPDEWSDYCNLSMLVWVLQERLQVRFAPTWMARNTMLKHRVAYLVYQCMKKNWSVKAAERMTSRRSSVPLCSKAHALRPFIPSEMPTGKLEAIFTEQSSKRLKINTYRSREISFLAITSQKIPSLYHACGLTPVSTTLF